MKNGQLVKTFKNRNEKHCLAFPEQNIKTSQNDIKQHLQQCVAHWPSPSHRCYVCGGWTSTVPGSFAGKQANLSDADASAPSQCEHDAFGVSFESTQILGSTGLRLHPPCPLLSGRLQDLQKMEHGQPWQSSSRQSQAQSVSH